MNLMLFRSIISPLCFQAALSLFRDSNFWNKKVPFIHTDTHKVILRRNKELKRENFNAQVCR